jgi:hypothetical protein
MLINYVSPVEGSDLALSAATGGDAGLKYAIVRPVAGGFTGKMPPAPVRADIGDNVRSGIFSSPT